MKNKHYEGFEKERKFKMIMGQALCDCPVLKARTVRRIIAHVRNALVEYWKLDTLAMVRILEKLREICIGHVAALYLTKKA